MYTSEHVIQVWDDTHGDRIEVGPDRDGMQLVEIRSYNDENKAGDSITMTEERALLVAKAILQLYGKE